MKKIRFSLALILILLSAILMCSCFGDGDDGSGKDNDDVGGGGYVPQGEATVTFDSNGGSPIAPVTTDPGSIIENIPTPTRDGYEFKGWYMDGNGSTWDGFVPASITLKAEWDPIFYNITVNVNRFPDIFGFDTIEYTVESYMLDENDNKKPCTLDTSWLTGDFLPRGYRFAGWFKDEAYTQPFTEYGIGTDVIGNFDIYGKFEFWPYSYSERSDGTCSFSMKYYSDLVGDVPEEELEAFTEIVILDTYNGKPVTKISGDTFGGWSNVTSIVIPSSIKYIDSYTLHLDSVGKIYLPESIELFGYSAVSESMLYTTEYNGGVYAATKNNPYALFLRVAGDQPVTAITLHANTRAIASGAFVYDDDSYPSVGHPITEITIPDSVVGLGIGIFENCTQLKTVRLGKNVTTVHESAFYRATFTELIASADLLKHVDCTKIDTIILNGGTELGADTLSAFPNLKSITLSDSITSIHKNAFRSNPKLTTVNIATGVTSIDGLSFLDTITVEKTLYNGCYYVGNATNPYFLLYSCADTSLTSVSIHPNTNIIWNKAFAANHSLAAPTIPDSVVAVGSQAFSGTAMATWSGTNYDGGLYVGNTKNPRLLLIGVASGVTEFTMSENTVGYSDNAFKGNSTLKKVVFSSKITAIAGETFKNCSSLTSIYLPDGITEIGDRAFTGCSSLTELRVPSTVIKLGMNIFDFSVVDNPSTGMLKPVYSGALYNDGTGYYLGNENNQYHILYAIFSTSTSSTSSYTVKPNTVVVAPNVLRSDIFEVRLTDSVKIISDYAFGDRSGVNANAHVKAIGSIVLGNGVEHIGDYAFYACKNLTGALNEYSQWTALALPDSLTYLGKSAFEQCEKLRGVKFGKGLTEIKEDTFTLCYALTEIVIPSNINSIGEMAFWMCTGVKTVKIASGVEFIGKKAFVVNFSESTGNMLYDGRTYCGASSKPDGWHSEWISDNMTPIWGASV